MPFRIDSSDSELNSKTFEASNVVTDILQLDEMEKTKISYVNGALINQKSVYGFALTIDYGSVMSLSLIHISEPTRH